MFDAGIRGGFEQRAGGAGIVAVVLERIRHGLGHDDRGGEMDDGVHLVVRQHLVDQRAISDIAHDQWHTTYSAAETRREIVENDYALTARDQLQYSVASDVSSAAGDQYR